MTVDGASTVYLYDANRRQKESVTGAVTTIYSYNKNGNLLREQSPYAPTNQYAYVFGGSSGSLTLNKYDTFNRPDEAVWYTPKRQGVGSNPAGNATNAVK